MGAFASEYVSYIGMLSVYVSASGELVSGSDELGKEAHPDKKINTETTNIMESFLINDMIFTHIDNWHRGNAI